MAYDVHRSLACHIQRQIWKHPSSETVSAAVLAIGRQSSEKGEGDAEAYAAGREVVASKGVDARLPAWYQGCCRAAEETQSCVVEGLGQPGRRQNRGELVCCNILDSPLRPVQKARQAGHFNNIKGRGRPIARTTEDKNPFIGREEFLMNRIVQRQGAAPPWVEIQGGTFTAISLLPPACSV